MAELGVLNQTKKYSDALAKGSFTEDEFAYNIIISARKYTIEKVWSALPLEHKAVLQEWIRKHLPGEPIQILFSYGESYDLTADVIAISTFLNGNAK